MTDAQTILTLARVLKNSDQAIMVDQLLNWQLVGLHADPCLARATELDLRTNDSAPSQRTQ